jgi:hypothetical protein
MKLDTCAGRLFSSSVCVAISPRLLIKVYANRTGQKATGLLNQAAQTSYVRRQGGRVSTDAAALDGTDPATTRWPWPATGRR